MNINDPTHPRSENEFSTLLVSTFGPLRDGEDHIAGALAPVWMEILRAHRTWPPNEAEMNAARAKLASHAIRCRRLGSAVLNTVWDEQTERDISSWAHAVLSVFLAYRAGRAIDALPRNDKFRETER